MNKSDTINELAKALLEVQKEMVPIKKTADNPFFKSKFAPLDKVMPEALRILNKHGLSVTQPVSHIEGQSALTTLLMHESGEWISADQPLVLDKENPQGQGSAITYARRYALMAMIGMVAEDDDDGNKASQPRTVKYATDKQIKWIRDTARSLNDQLGDDEEVDDWVEEILTVKPKQVPIYKVKDAVDKLKKEAGGKELPDYEAGEGLDEIAPVTDEILEDFKKGNLPY